MMHDVLRKVKRRQKDAKKTKSTPKKAGPKKSRARKSDSIWKRKVAVKPTEEDSVLGKIKNAFDDTAAKIKMFLSGKAPAAGREHRPANHLLVKITDQSVFKF
jgi:hypothetical protein